jgi:antitoxin MazE
MRATVSRWGNSLALRLPRGIVGDANLAEGTVVDLVVEDGRIVITPAHAPVRLSNLLNRFEPHHRHDPMDDCPEVGAERI